MKRSVRRHHEKRIKKLWVKRIKRFWRVDPNNVEAFAVRRAHHNKCPCSLCRKTRYKREKYPPIDQLEDRSRPKG